MFLTSKFSFCISLDSLFSVLYDCVYYYFNILMAKTDNDKVS